MSPWLRFSEDSANIVKELEHILCFHVVPPGDLDLDPMTQTKQYGSSLHGDLQSFNEVIFQKRNCSDRLTPDAPTDHRRTDRSTAIGHPHSPMRGPNEEMNKSRKPEVGVDS
jgi:hypothetical protein